MEPWPAVSPPCHGRDHKMNGATAQCQPYQHNKLWAIAGNLSDIAGVIWDKIASTIPDPPENPADDNRLSQRLLPPLIYLPNSSQSRQISRFSLEIMNEKHIPSLSQPGFDHGDLIYRWCLVINWLQQKHSTDAMIRAEIALEDVCDKLTNNFTSSWYQLT